MATLTASVFTSHVPAIGVAHDLGKTEENYWKPLFAGYEFSKTWMQQNLPGVIFLVYNDHANAFDANLIPTFALGTGAHYPIADEGWGPRPVPAVDGHPELASYIAQNVIEQGFDLTLVNEMTVDHGLTVPLTLMFGQCERWPCRVIPLHVNVVQYPAPSGTRCWELGRALKKAIESYPENIKVQVWGTGGMSHQLQGKRAGLINREWDQHFLDNMIHNPVALSKIPHIEYLREAGSEGIELVMWLIARAAMSDLDTEHPNPSTHQVKVIHRFYHVPASNTAVGHLILQNC